MEWSTYVKSTRKRMGLTQTEFGNVLGVSLSGVQSWEYGRTKPLPLHQDILCQINSRLDILEQSEKDERFVNTLKDVALGAGVAFGVYQLLKIIFDDKENKA